MATLIARFSKPLARRLRVGHLVMLIALVLLTVTASPANASAIINVNQVGPDVVFTLSGSLDLAGATADTTYPSYGVGFIPGGDNWYIATGNGSGIQTYSLTSYDGPFGSDTTFFTPPTSSTGSNFFIWGFGGSNPRQVGVPVGYVSGSALNAVMTFSGTLADFSLIPGTYLYTIPSDTITLNIGAATTPVPEPATLLLVGGGVAALLRRRRAARP